MAVSRNPGAAAVDEVAAVVQRAEQLEQRQAGHSADARADAAAQIAVHVDGTPVRVAVGRQAAHAVVRDGNKGIEGFKNKIDHQRQNDGSGLRGFEIAEQQYHRNRPGHREPQREGAAALAVFEFVVHGPEADQRVVDRVPDGSDGQDHARDEHVDLQYIGEEKQIINALELVHHVAGGGKGQKAELFPKFQRRDHICPNILLHTVGSSFSRACKRSRSRLLKRSGSSVIGLWPDCSNQISSFFGAWIKSK
jgi:hypothetical protein